MSAFIKPLSFDHDYDLAEIRRPSLFVHVSQPDGKKSVPLVISDDGKKLVPWEIPRARAPPATPLKPSTPAVVPASQRFERPPSSPPPTAQQVKETPTVVVQKPATRPPAWRPDPPPKSPRVVYASYQRRPRKHAETPPAGGRRSRAPREAAATTKRRKTPKKSRPPPERSPSPPPPPPPPPPKETPPAVRRAVPTPPAPVSAVAVRKALTDLFRLTRTHTPYGPARPPRGPRQARMWEQKLSEIAARMSVVRAPPRPPPCRATPLNCSRPAHRHHRHRPFCHPLGVPVHFCSPFSATKFAPMARARACSVV